MPVNGVGSKQYFELRKNEIQSINRVGEKGADIASAEEENEFSFTLIAAMVGKAFRTLIECFTSEGRYEKKLQNRIDRLNDKNFDNYEHNLEDFYTKQLEILRVKAFEGFKISLPKFYELVKSDSKNEKIKHDDEMKDAYPDLHEKLVDACSLQKTDACEAFIALPAILDAIAIDDPKTPLEQFILELKQEFVKGAETKTFLDANVMSLRDGLNLKKNNISKLYQFLQPNDAHMSAIVANLDAWKLQMKNQRVNFLKALPNVHNDLIYYSFESEQISRVKKVLKLQNKEINSYSKLEASLANFIAEKALEKTEQDIKKINTSRDALFEKFNERSKKLEGEKAKAEEKLELSKEQQKLNKVAEIQLRLDKIQTSQANNDKCLEVLNNSFEKWLDPLKVSYVDLKNNINTCSSSKNATLKDFATVQRELNLAPNLVQDTIDAMLAEAAFNLFYIKVENQADPKPLQEDATPEEIKETKALTIKFLSAIQEIQKDHIRPLLVKSKAANANPDWAKEAKELLGTIQPELENLRKKYQDILDACNDGLDEGLQAAMKASNKEIIPTGEELAADDAFLESLKAVGYTHHPVKGDGNCFFYSCVKGLKRLGPEYDALKGMDGVALRQALYAYIKDNAEEFNSLFARYISGLIDDFVRLKEEEVEDALLKVAAGFQNVYRNFRKTYIENATPAQKQIFSAFISQIILKNTKGISLYADAMANTTNYVDDFELTAFTKFAGLDIAVHSLAYPNGPYVIEQNPGNPGTAINLRKPKFESHYDYLEAPKA